MFRKLLYVFCLVSVILLPTLFFVYFQQTVKERPFQPQIVTITPTQKANANLSVLKFSLAEHKISIVENSYKPKSILVWHKEINPIATINGSFFMEDFTPAAYVVIGGERVGTRDLGADFTGFFNIKDTGISITQKKSNASNILQGYPLLIYNSEIYLTNSTPDRARRSAVALDDKHLYLIVSHNQWYTLSEFTTEIMKTLPEVNESLNLDGGTSTGLWGSDDQHTLQINSLTQVPNVLVVQTLK